MPTWPSVTSRCLRFGCPDALNNNAGIPRVSARRQLEHFHTTGHADVTLRYGTAGRPERLYSWRG